MKSRTITSKIPPRFAKKQGSMSIEQPEEALSSNNLGTEIWETNSSGNKTDSSLLVHCAFVAAIKEKPLRQYYSNFTFLESVFPELVHKLN